MPRLRHYLALLVALTVSSSVFAQRDPLPPQDAAIVKQQFPNAKKTITGLRYIIAEAGQGENARAGDRVSVVFRGKLIDGTVFNEVLDPKDPFTFRLGRGEVIDGWDQGIKLMNEGAKMTLVVPYELGYGTRGNPPMVPKQATLIFEIQLLKIERGLQPPPLPDDQARKGKKKKKNKD